MRWQCWEKPKEECGGDSSQLVTSEAIMRGEQQVLLFNVGSLLNPCVTKASLLLIAQHNEEQQNKTKLHLRLQLNKGKTSLYENGAYNCFGSRQVTNTWVSQASSGALSRSSKWLC